MKDDNWNCPMCGREYWLKDDCGDPRVTVNGKQGCDSDDCPVHDTAAVADGNGLYDVRCPDCSGSFKMGGYSYDAVCEHCGHEFYVEFKQQDDSDEIMKTFGDGLHAVGGPSHL